MSAAASSKAREAFLSDDPNSGDDGLEVARHAGEWMEHRGGEMPAIGERNVCVRYRNGIVSDPIAARMRRWKSWPAELGDSEWDIVAWKFANPSK